MEKPFFAMMYSQDSQWAMPIVDEDGKVVFWPTESDAREAMAKHPFAEKLGYELFSMEKPFRE